MPDERCPKIEKSEIQSMQLLSVPIFPSMRSEGLNHGGKICEGINGNITALVQVDGFHVFTQTGGWGGGMLARCLGIFRHCWEFFFFFFFWGNFICGVHAQGIAAWKRSGGKCPVRM